MKYYVLTYILLAASISFGQYKGDTFRSAKADRSATVYYLYSNAPGFVSKEGDTFSGVCVDIMKQFEKYVKDKYDITLNVRHVSEHYNNFPEFLNLVKNSNGGVFGLNTTTITDKRKGIFEMSPHFITNVSMLVSNNAAPTLNSLGELPSKFSNMTAVTVENSSNKALLLAWKSEYYPAMKMRYVNTNEEVMKRVASEVDKFTNVDFIYYFEALRDGKPIKRHPVGDSAKERFGIIMPKGSDWPPVLAEFLNSGFIESTEYRKILSEHLGSSAMKFFEALK